MTVRSESEVDDRLLVGFLLLFWSLKGFSTQMKSIILFDTKEEDVHSVVHVLGERLLGSSPIDTFIRGLVLTIIGESRAVECSPHCINVANRLKPVQTVR